MQTSGVAMSMWDRGTGSSGDLGAGRAIPPPAMLPAEQSQRNMMSSKEQDASPQDPEMPRPMITGLAGRWGHGMDEAGTEHADFVSKLPDARHGFPSALESRPLL